MKSNIIKSIALIVFSSLAFSACTESDRGYDNTSTPLKTYELTTTTTPDAIILAATATPTVHVADDVIEAYVTSNDAAGNFYKSISMQTIPTDASAPKGFSISVDKSMLFVNGFTPGRKVYIRLMGLAVAKVYGTTVIGLVDPADATQLTGISELDFQNFLFPSATIVPEDTFVRHMTLAQAATDPNQNTLIEIDNVEFADNSIARTYYDINSGGFATNHDIVDVTAGGTTRFLRVSQYSPFSVKAVPAGRGSIRGVMTKYSSDYQFMIRQESDIKLINPRTYNFFSTLNESFTSYATGQVAFPNYLNFSPVGTKKWQVKSGALEMSSFSGATEYNKAYFVVPVDMTAANSLKFDLKVTFFTGSLGLKVYRSTDYVPGMKISDATLFDISSAFSIPFPVATATLTGLTYNIPTTVTGNGYFIFEYSGNNFSNGPAVTTTVDLDNIIIN